MTLTNSQIAQIRKDIDECKRPIIFFDDDCDGLTSFLMIYNYKKVGKGIPIRNAPEVTAEYVRKVEEYDADLIIVLDLPLVSQEFIDNVKQKIVWIDHHQIADRKNVNYYNPASDGSNDNRPTSYWTYKVINDFLWIAMCGIVGDWHMPEDEIKNRYCEEYPDLMSKEFTRADAALHNSKLGMLVRVIEFNMKGKIADILQSVKVFSRIKSPYEIINQETAAGKFIWKKFMLLEKEYQSAMKDAQTKAKQDDKSIIYVHKEKGSNGFSRYISNYFFYKHPEKLILIATERQGEYTCSLRSTKRDLPKIINKAIESGIRGYGGGHKSAAGACINSEDFDKFLQIIKSEA